MGTPRTGKLYEVSIKDASCTPAPGGDLPPPWMLGGTAFVNKKGNPTDETLYFSGFKVGYSPGLAKVDTTTGQVTAVGQYDGLFEGQPAEMNGTAAGRLFGFFGRTFPPQIAEIDPPTAKVSGAVSLEIGDPFLFDFSFWGGDFYIYTLPDPNSFPNNTTRVSAYRTATNKLEDVILSVGFIIDAVGVSTCEPLEPPK